MPSVEMRRSTRVRVFGTRVLRSWRRVWTEPREGGKHVRASLGENKFQELLDSSVYGGGDIDDCHKELWWGYKNSTVVGTIAETKMEEREPDGVDEKNVDRKCRIVYGRKRKRAESTNTKVTEDGRFAKKYVRKQWRTRCGAIESFGPRGCMSNRVRTQTVALVVNETSYDCYYWITCLLTSLLSYMTRARIEMCQLSAFMLSEPIFGAYSSCGVLILQDPDTAEKPCVCIVSGPASMMPLFSFNIFAIPPLFAHMQTSMCLRSAHLYCLLIKHCENYEEVMDVDDAEESAFQSDQQDCIYDISEMSTRSDTSLIKLVVSDNDTSGGRQLRQSAGTLARSSRRNLTLRNSRKIKKRRSSLRRKRGRPPTAFKAQKAKGALASELFRIKHEGAHFRTASPSPYKRRSAANIKDLKSTTAAATQDASVNSCSANLLITDTEKCYRVEGATITLELSTSNQWFLTVTKCGIKQCSLTAQKFMRPPSSNRSTHAVIWSGDRNLKFEFPDKRYWLIFKELYKECSDRNMQSPAASFIPIPGVQEVLIPFDQNLPFVRPESYISLKDDELTRALMNKTANYDMDYDDEEWLGNLNNELNAGSELPEFFAPENFELVIDALEKGDHCNPNEHLLDEQVAYDICIHLGKKEIIEAVYKYWIRKRKLKRSALVKVFQLYQPRRSQVIPKFFLRKKRSFKRRASQGGRGKQWHSLKAAERDAVEHKSNGKLQEAKAAVDRNEGVATLKRQRAQMLMENANLATYKAMMALKIAEAAAAQVVCYPVERCSNLMNDGQFFFELREREGDNYRLWNCL